MSAGGVTLEQRINVFGLVEKALGKQVRDAVKLSTQPLSENRALLEGKRLFQLVMRALGEFVFFKYIDSYITTVMCLRFMSTHIVSKQTHFVMVLFVDAHLPREKTRVSI